MIKYNKKIYGPPLLLSSYVKENCVKIVVQYVSFTDTTFGMFKVSKPEFFKHRIVYYRLYIRLLIRR